MTRPAPSPSRCWRPRSASSRRPTGARPTPEVLALALVRVPALESPTPVEGPTAGPPGPIFRPSICPGAAAAAPVEPLRSPPCWRSCCWPSCAAGGPSRVAHHLDHHALAALAVEFRVEDL